MDVGEPLLLIGSCNDWQLDVARRQHCFTPVDFGSSEQSQESVLQLEVPKGALEFQIVSAVSTWKWRLHPCSDLHCVLQRDRPEHVPVRLSRGSSSEAAHGLNFVVDAPPGKLVDIRVLLSTRFGICVWYSNSTVGLTTQEAACPPTAPAAPAAKRRPESPAALKRTAERVGAFSAFKQRNQPQSMDAFQRGGAPMAPRPKQRSTPGAFSRAVATPTTAGAVGAGEPQAFRPAATRPPRRVVRLSLEEAKDLLEALRRVCSHQTFRRELDVLRRRDLGAFKKRQAMAKLLGQWWKEQLRESGFTVDEHGFPQMLAAVAAHRDSAGVDIVSREAGEAGAVPESPRGRGASTVMGVSAVPRRPPKKAAVHCAEACGKEEHPTLLRHRGPRYSSAVAAGMDGEAAQEVYEEAEAGARPAYAHGAVAEFYSEPLQRWLTGVVRVLIQEGSQEPLVSYEVSVAPRQLQRGAALASLREPLRAGEPADVLLPSGGWRPAAVRAVHQSSGPAPVASFQVEVDAGAGAPFLLSGVPPERLRRRFPEAAAVEVYRGPVLGWVPAVVCSAEPDQPPQPDHVSVLLAKAGHGCTLLPLHLVRSRRRQRG